MWLKTILIAIFLSVSFCTNAQKEANIWYFGDHAGLDFNSGAPVVLLDGALNTNEGCATISDSNGNLLFYTDGGDVYNRLHNVIPNTGLSGSSSSTHSAIIVPKPQDPNIYYIFTVGAGGTGSLTYSELDMTLDGGLGDITANKNIFLFNPVNEKVTAIQKSNLDGYWVVSHKYNSDEFLTYEVNATGVNTTPVVTAIGSNTGFFNISGQIKISPDNSKLAVARGDEIQLFDFDNAIGVIKNPQTINIPTGGPYGIEFSANGNVLYAAFGGYVSQYNLQAGTLADIIASEVTLVSLSNSNGGFSSLQIAPDGKIYIARSNKLYIDFIDFPNVIGLGCNYNYDGLFLNGRESNLGLPTFIQSFFDVAFQVDNVCFGETTTFNGNIPPNYDSLLWEFGDGMTSTLETPLHTYASSGIFTANLTVTVNGQSSSNSREVTIYEQPTAFQPQNMPICDDNNDGFTNFDLTTQNTDLLNGQNANTFNITYYASIADYNALNPITDPTNYVNTNAYASQTIVASVFNSASISCEDSTTFNIQMFETPMPSMTVPSLRLCDNASIGTDTDGSIEFDLSQNEMAILNGQSSLDFSVNYFTDVGLTNEITNPAAYHNTNPTETIFVQMVNNTNNICSDTTTFTIEVFELPTVTPIVELKQCDDNLDGYSVFNLTEVNAEISVNHINETITFYEFLADAESGGTPNLILNETTYTNQEVSTDIVWARIENSNGCHRTSQVNLIISTTQIPNTFTRGFYQCDDGMNTSDGIATFNFNSVNTEIQAMFPVGQQLIINYYKNQADALSEINPIANIANYQNIGYPNTQNVFIRVDSALDNDCLGLGHHITLHVETVPVANLVTIDEQCDDDGDGMYAFDTSNIETILVSGQTNLTVEYFDGMGNALPSPLPNPFLTASQTITARVTNATSQDPDGACYDETQLVFTVDAAAVAYPVSDFMGCDVDNDNQFEFDTSSIETTVLNGQTGMIVSYTNENGNALTSPLPNPFITVSQAITVRVENPLNAICFDETTINFIVNEQPTANSIANDFVCDDMSNDGEHIFTLSDYDSQMLNGQSSALFEVLYFDASNALLPNSYSVNSISETITARIQNRNNPNCFDSTSFELGVHYLPIANQPQDILVCDDQSNDGIEVFDLSIQNSDILNGQTASENIVSYHLLEAEAESGVNSLNTYFPNTENPQTIYVRLENVNFTDCFTLTSFQVIVNKQPVLLMNELWPICEGDTVEIIADSGYDQYLWSTDETSETIIVDVSGTYELTITNIYGNLRCEDTKTLTVAESNIATITAIETIDWTQSNNVITVFVEGNGDYEYSIDGVNYQDSNVFNGLSIDEYDVYVRDKNGCGIITENIYLLYYPRFFTPNGDGYNDIWQLVNSTREPNNKIYIFDRYGKLLRQLSPLDIGWDGTFNGSRLPSNDYWFMLERQNGRTYRGHFSLKR